MYHVVRLKKLLFWWAWSGILLCFFFTFCWWLMKLNSFLHISWPFGFLFYFQAISLFIGVKKNVLDSNCLSVICVTNFFPPTLWLAFLLPLGYLLINRFLILLWSNWSVFVVSTFSLLFKKSFPNQWSQRYSFESSPPPLKALFSLSHLGLRPAWNRFLCGMRSGSDFSTKNK